MNYFVYISHHNVTLFSGLCRWKIFSMDPLCKATLLWILAFMILASLCPFLFVHVEYTNKDNKEEKFQLLLSLYKSMALKYNMTIPEFNNFSNVAYEALSEPKPQWTYVDGMDFVLQTLTTIGKAEVQHISSMYYLRKKGRISDCHSYSS